MASIKPHKDRWRAWVKRKEFGVVSRVFRKKSDAEAWAKRMEREIAIGRNMDESKRTLAHAITEYLKSPAGEKLGKHEQNILEWWRQTLGRRRLLDLKRGDFMTARDKIRGIHGQALAPATINRRMAAIAAVLTFAMDRDWIPVNAARIRRRQENNQRERLLDAKERKRLLEACRDSVEPDLYALVLCAMVSGGRAGELTRLTWADVDLEKGQGHLLKTKTGTRRPIPLKGPALTELRIIAERRAGAEPTDFIFQHADGSAPFQYGRAWRQARVTARVTDVKFHDLRHLFASELAMDGVSTRELQHALGHANAQMTARYSHFVAERTDELGDRVVARLFPEEEGDHDPAHDGR